jgi:hypothetical protein
MADEVEPAIIAPELEEAVLRCKPAIDDLDDGDPRRAELDSARGLFASMA